MLRHGKITTTLTRAKAIRKYVDKMVTLSKRGTLHSKRQVRVPRRFRATLGERGNDEHRC